MVAYKTRRSVIPDCCYIRHAVYMSVPVTRGRVRRVRGQAHRMCRLLRARLMTRWLQLSDMHQKLCFQIEPLFICKRLHIYTEFSVCRTQLKSWQQAKQRKHVRRLLGTWQKKILKQSISNWFVCTMHEWMQILSKLLLVLTHNRWWQPSAPSITATRNSQSHQTVPCVLSISQEALVSSMMLQSTEPDGVTHSLILSSSMNIFNN